MAETGLAGSRRNPRLPGSTATDRPGSRRTHPGGGIAGGVRTPQIVPRRPLTHPLSRPLTAQRRNLRVTPRMAVLPAVSTSPWPL